MNIGIIAEDDSDVEVMKEITSTILKPHTIGFKHFVGDGCGKVRRKCAAWAEILVRRGCQWVAVVHDLDEYDERELRTHLELAVRAAGARADVVVIPKREIEAWLLYDSSAIATAFQQRERPRLPGDPEVLHDPKRHLRDLIWSTYRQDYVNTIHNPKIARQINHIHLRRSGSFAPYPIFAAAVKEALIEEWAVRRSRKRRKQSKTRR